MSKSSTFLHSIRQLAPYICNSLAKRHFSCKQSSYNWSRYGVQEMPTIGVVGAPCSRGQGRPGVSRAPTQLRDAGMLRQLQLMGYKVIDYGDLQFTEVPDDTPLYNMKNPRTVGAAAKQISETVHSVISQGHICLTLGGDHSMSLGTIHGHAQAKSDIALIWVDAHADLNPPLASISGNIHGMPLSFLTYELDEYIPKVEGFEWLKPCIHAKNIAFIGLRDLDPAERYIIDKLGITCFTVHEIDKYGIHQVLDEAIDAINPNLERPMHLSYDIDALDPVVSPSTGTPVPGGMTIREGMYVAEELALTGKLTGIDLVEVNPELGEIRDQDLTLFTASEVIAACFGKRRTGNVPPGYVLPKP